MVIVAKLDNQHDYPAVVNDMSNITPSREKAGVDDRSIGGKVNRQHAVGWRQSINLVARALCKC
jgi:hypothetical protein